MRLSVFYSLLFCALFLFPVFAEANVNIEAYDVRIDSIALQQHNKITFDSTLQQLMFPAKKKLINQVIRLRSIENHSLEFYLLLALCALLGAIKSIHPKYFSDVWRGFFNPTLGSRQLKDLIQSATFPNLLLNLFSSIVLGLYVYYLISLHVDWRFASLPSALMLGLLILGAVLLHAGKYIFVQLGAWVFGKGPIGEQYNFNVFLVNKVIGISLLPFVICFAFLQAKWHGILMLCSLILLGLLYLNRYLRSWNIFAPFFQNSRLHFFMYLCAFEILPMAVLLKFVWMIV
jgi:hypothetical protein